MSLYTHLNEVKGEMRVFWKAIFKNKIAIHFAANHSSTCSRCFLVNGKKYSQ